MPSRETQNTKAPHLRRGEDAEAQALAFLTGNGLVLVARNWRCRAGELDLIMREGDTLVFVEVRYRSNPRFGGALESIDRHKQRRLLAAARHYLQRYGEQPCRVDVVALGPGSDAIQWLKNAISS